MACYQSTSSKPTFRLPQGSVDAHCHVIGPSSVFPYAEDRKYVPVDAPKEELWKLRDLLGFSRNVIVQASCHGTDNRAMLDALADSDNTARGVASVKPDVTEAQLEELHQAGVRGVRFSFSKKLVSVLPYDELVEIAPRIVDLGWHVVIYSEASELASLYQVIKTLPGIVVFDHMACPNVAETICGADFQRFLWMLEKHENFWCKVTCPDRRSLLGPPRYEDVVPFAKLIVERFSDRVLAGTDWPHPNIKTPPPDDGVLVDFIPQIAVTQEQQQKLLVDNPMRLYWPGEAY